MPLVIVLTLMGFGACAPTHCWDFAYASSTLADSCGSAGTLSATRKIELIKAGTMGGPFCDGSGCAFDNSASYTGPFSSSIGSEWTLLVWALFTDGIGSLEFQVCTISVFLVWRQHFIGI